MKIYSKFQDYYDSALGSFLESDVIVNRKTSLVKISYKEMPDLGEFDLKYDVIKKSKYGTSYSYLPMHAVGFCGKWYFYLHESNADSIDINYYVYKTFDEIVDNNTKMSLFGWKKAKEFKDPNNDPYWKELFEKYGPVLFINEYNSPGKYYLANTYKNMELTIWPELKPLYFQKVKDPYTALWEIEHWFDSHAKPDEAVVPVGDDITRLQAYGFDKKTSFRKGKEK